MFLAPYGALFSHRAILLQLWAIFTHPGHKVTTVAQNHNNVTNVTQINLEQLMQYSHNKQTNTTIKQTTQLKLLENMTMYTYIIQSEKPFANAYNVKALSLFWLPFIGLVFNKVT